MKYRAYSATDPNSHFAKAFSILMNSVTLAGHGADTTELRTSIQAELGAKFCARNADKIDKFIEGLSAIIIERDKQIRAEQELRKKLLTQR